MQLTISSTAEDYEIDVPEKTEVFLSLERVNQTVKVKCSLKLYKLILLPATNQPDKFKVLSK